MSNFKMPNAYHPSNSEWVRPIELLTSDGVMELQRLKAENAKLRELVRDMYEMAYPEYPSAFEAAFADRMRELGVDE